MNPLFANKIDSIKTNEDVVALISKLYQEKYNETYYIFSIEKPDSVCQDFICDSTIAKWDIKKWQKLDFNHDTLTDLFAILYMRNRNDKGAGYVIYTVIDNGDNTFSLQNLPDYFLPDCYAAIPIHIDENPFLLYRHYNLEYTIDALFDDVPNRDNIHYYQIAKTDTLIYKYGGFIELNTGQFSPPVKSIFFETTLCFGSCPVFKLNILEDRTAYYLADMYNNRQGNFRTTIRAKELREILDLIKYLNIPALKNNYEVHATDLPSSTIKIYFFDGSRKEIRDYGLQGTLGLVRLYRLLFALRDNQNWK